MPVLTYETLELVPKDFQGEAKQDKEGEGPYKVNVSLTSKVTEFRESNVELSKKAEGHKALQDKYGGMFTGEVTDIDGLLVEVKDLRDMKVKVDDGTLKTTDEVSVEVEKRTTTMRETHSKQEKELQTKLDNVNGLLEKSESKLRDTKLEGAITALISDPEIGFRASARKAIIAEARDVFKPNKEGIFVAKDDSGATLYGEDGQTPLSFREWADGSLRKSADYLYAPSKGSQDQQGDYEVDNSGAPTEEAMKGMSASDLWAAIPEGK